MSEPSSPLESQKQKESRLIEELEKQRIEKPRTENLMEIIQYHAKATHLTPPLYTARAQQETNQRAETAAKKKPAGKGKEKLLMPLVQQQGLEYENLIKYLMTCNLHPSEYDQLQDDLEALLKMKNKGHYTEEELNKLSEIIQSLNKLGDKLAPGEKQQYWSKVALMYDVMAKMNKKLGANAKSNEAQQLYKSLGDLASEDSGAAAARADGNESLAQAFMDDILGRYMPGAEAQLMAIAILLQFNNFGAETINDLLGDINDFGEATNNYGLNSLLHGADSSGHYPDGKDIENQWHQEQQAAERDQGELSKLNKDLDSKIASVDEKLKNATDPKVIKGLQELKQHLEGEKGQVAAAQKNLTNLQKIIGIPGEPNSGTMRVTVNADGTATVTGDKGLSEAEDAVINGTGKNGEGGLMTIQQDLKGFQESYTNQSQTQQMQLQLTMTEVQQAWTVVSTCMTTLNQTMMALAQAIYK